MKPGFDPWLGKIPWRRERLPTLVFWPREFHEQSMGLQRFRHDWVTFTFTFPWWLSGKESTCQYRKCRFDPWVGKIPWRREWQPTPVFLPGKSHGQRSLAGYSQWGCKRVRHHLGTKQQQQYTRFHHHWDQHRPSLSHLAKQDRPLSPQHCTTPLLLVLPKTSSRFQPLLLMPCYSYSSCDLSPGPQTQLPNWLPCLQACCPVSRLAAPPAGSF